MGFFIMLLVNVAIAVLTDHLTKQKLEDAKPSGLGDFRFPTATEGRFVPLIWGTVKIESPNVVWYGDLEQEAIRGGGSSGLSALQGGLFGKGLFSSKSQVTGYRYHLGMQSALSMGDVDELRRIWIGDDVVADFTSSPITHDTTFTIDEPKLFGGESLGQGGVVGTWRFFAGTSTQGVSSYLANSDVVSATVGAGGSGYSEGDILTEAGDGTAPTRATFRVDAESSGVVTAVTLVEAGSYSIESTDPAATTVAPPGGTGCTLAITYSAAFQSAGGATPAYRDVCYVVNDTERAYLGTSSSIKPWAYELRRTPNGLGLSDAQNILASGGVNCASVIYEVLTSADWGYGEDTADIDTSDFTAAAATLAAENNGFSFILDRPEDRGDLIRRLEDQIDGLVFKDPFSGKWKIKLARADYDILTVPEVNSTNMRSLVSFNRGTWEGTTNQIRTPFNDASDNYKSSYGFAQDMANVRILGRNTSKSVTHPGVKDRGLANDLASREMRTLSIPLAVGSLIVDRSLYGVMPYDVIALTDADLGFVRLPIRVRDVDYGDILNGKIAIEFVQDVFFSAAGIFDPAPASGWVPLVDALVPFAADGQIAIEAPRALTLRDPLGSSPITDKLYVAARRQGPEAAFQIVERNAVGTPSGDFSDAGEVFGFSLLGELLSGLTPGSAYPLSSLTLIPNPDSQASILAEIPTLTDIAGLGSDLLTLCMVGDEFFLVTSAQASGNNVQLNGVYRSVLDSVQGAHSAGAKVFLLFVGAGISLSTVLAGNNVDVKLLPQSVSNLLEESSAITIALTMANRTRRPYPPASFDLNGTTLDTTSVVLAGSGSGENVGVLVDAIIRRDLRTVDEIEALTTDAAVLFSDFPAKHTTTVEVEVLDGVAVLASTTGISGTSATMRQLDILAGLDTTTLPASLTFLVRQSHTFDGVVYASLHDFPITSTIVSPLIGKHAWGELDDSEASVSDFTVVADTVDHVFGLSTSFTLGAVEYRLNGGAWVNLITAGGTSGTILAAALTNGDTIGIRHLSTDTSPQKLLTMTVSGTPEAYAVLIS